MVISTSGAGPSDQLETVLAEPAGPAPAGGAWRRMGRAVVHNKMAVAGLLTIAGMALFCFAGPAVYHSNQVNTNLGLVHLAPGAGHPLGTDGVGHDELGRLMLGGQSSLEVGLAAAVLAALLGTAWGAVAGYLGGWTDAFMMRVVDSFLAIPYLLFAILFLSIFAPSVPTLIIVVSLSSWLITARLVRGESLTLRTRAYVQVARGLGARNWRIVSRHIVPNAISTIVVQATFSVADAILLLAALSFLGFGPPSPGTNWGQMLSDGLNYAYDGYWWLIYPPGIAIVVTVLAFNFIGDALRDALEVRLAAI
jgi:peptide/nickel transport system permease protein